MPAHVPALPAGAVDAGRVPSSQTVTFTVYLAPTADRVAALDTFLSAVTDQNSPQYHHWATPQSFAMNFGATSESIAAVQAWAAQQGFQTAAASAAGTSLTFSGTAAQVEAAISPALHVIALSGTQLQANTAVPTLPSAIASQVITIDGLSTLPAATAGTIRTEAGQFTATDTLAALNAAVDANTTRLLSITSHACTDDVDAATTAALHALLRQAAAQGITTLASSGCNGRGSASLPAAFAETVAVAISPGVAPSSSPTLSESRPIWQDVPGLPDDAFRHEPDLTVSSLSALESTVLQILAKQPATGDGSLPRLGNIAQELYALSPIQDLYTQPDTTVAGTWEPATGLGLINLSSLLKHYPAGTTTSQTQITPVGGTYSITYGGTASYTIAVSGSNGTPTGTVVVSFSPGGYSTQATLNNGQATFSLSDLGTAPAAGQYTITATYNGDGTYTGSSGTTSLYVGQQQLSIQAAAASTSGTLVVGGAYQVTVTLQGTSGAPSGTLTITPSPGTALTPSFTGSNGAATVTANFTAAAAGTVYINAACTNVNANYVCYNANTTISVGKATPVLSALSISPNPPTANSTTTLTVTVAGAGGSAPSPSGSVAFTDAKGNSLCTTPYTSSLSGSISCTTTSLAPTGNGTVTASYIGDGNYTAATTTAQYTGSAITTTVSLTTNKTAVTVGGSVTLTATITPQTTLNNTPLTGTLTFYDAAGQLGSQQSISNYQTSANVTVTLPTQGVQAIYAVYSGDSNYSGKTSNTVNVTVGPSTSVTFSASPSAASITYGNIVMLTAVVMATPTDGSNAITGSLTFNIDGVDHITVPGTVVQTSGNTLTVTDTISQALDASNYLVKLSCNSSNFDCSNLTSLGNYQFTIAPANTTTTLALSSTTLTGGSTITATATVAPAAVPTGTNGVITGTVTFYDNANVAATVNLGNNDQASTTITLSSAGGDNIVAVYSGDKNNNSSKSNGTTGTGGSGGGTTTTPSTTGITVSANPSTALSGSAVAVTATVVATAASGSAAAPGSANGTVYFYDTVNNTQFLLGSATLGSAGLNTSTAVLYTTGLLAGANTITAAFLGSTNYSASTTPMGIVVQITDYTVSFTPTSVNLTAGQSTTVTAAVNAVNGFSGSVVLGCTAPSGSAISCAFNPTVVNTSGLTTLTITTTTRSSLDRSRTAVEAVGSAAGALLLGLLLPASRRRRLQLLAILTLVALGSTLGCTNIIGGPAGSGLGSGTPAGTEVLTITTSGTNGTTTVRHNYQISVNVQ